MAIVLIAIVIIVLFGGAVLIGSSRRKRAVAGLGEMAAYCRQRGWRQAEPDRYVTQRTLLLYQATGSTALRVQGQFAGDHRGVSFQAAQVCRPPTPGRTTSQVLSVVYIPRPVAGPRLQLAKQGLSSATFLSRDTQIGNAPFDAAFHVNTEDDAFARTVLHPGLANSLAQDARVQHSIIAFEQQHLFAMQHGGLTPQKLQDMLDLLIDIHHTVPWQALHGPGQS